MSDSLDTITIYSLLDDMEEVLQNTRDVLAVIGAAYVTKVALQFSWRLLGAIRTYVIPRVWHDKNFPKKYGGKWAVVTGASEGIGRSYAFKLAERNMNIFLISRSGAKLQKVAEEIEKRHGVLTKIFPIDCSTLSNPACFEELKKEIDGLDVGVLVNNVGQMYEKLQYFLNVPRQVLSNIVDINIHATVLMTNMVLPQMVTRKKGAIINLGSLAGRFPTPLMTAYGASKSFINDFTLALDYEYSSQGITMQVINPSYVSTSLTYNPEANFYVIGSDDYVEGAIRTLGVSRQNYGYWVHGLVGAMSGVSLWLYMCLAINVNPRIWFGMTGMQI